VVEGDLDVLGGDVLLGLRVRRVGAAVGMGEVGVLGEQAAQGPGPEVVGAARVDLGRATTVMSEPG
jgi:hypothetical protein